MENEKNTKKKVTKRNLLCVLLPVGIISLLFVCGIVYFALGGQEEEPVTLKFLMIGTEPDGMDDVLEEFYRRTKDTLGIRIEMEWFDQLSEYKVISDMKLSAREGYDLVFDASWVHLYEMQEKGIYADLSPYLNNPDYPGLYSAFSATALKNNLINGEQCALPLFRTYGSGIPCIYYRKDLALKYGINSINSVDELEMYMQALLRNERDMIPLVLTGYRGFYTFSPKGHALTFEQGRRIVYPITIGGITVVAQLDDSLTKVEAVGMMGYEESFSDFMEGLQFDFLIGRLDGYRDWNQYCEDDVLNRTDQERVFQAGLGGAFIATLDNYEEVSFALAENLADASLGVYIINDSIRNMDEQSISTSYLANNYICIPAFSEHIEETVYFLDWLFASRENHDLFEHGIEGVHWRAIGEDRYEAIADQSGKYYIFPGYTMTWNSHYVRFSESVPEDILAYKEYELLESTFYRNLLTGFSFDDDDLRSQMVKVEQIFSQVWPALSNGILDEPDTILRDAVEKAKRYGLQDILAEVKRQLQEFLDQNPENNS